MFITTPDGLTRWIDARAATALEAATCVSRSVYMGGALMNTMETDFKRIYGGINATHMDSIESGATTGMAGTNAQEI